MRVLPDELYEAAKASFSSCISLSISCAKDLFKSNVQDSSSPDLTVILSEFDQAPVATLIAPKDELLSIERRSHVSLA